MCSQTSSAQGLFSLGGEYNISTTGGGISEPAVAGWDGIIDRVRPAPVGWAVERMKEKHLRIRIEQCLTLAKASNCPRANFGSLLIDPDRNVILMDGYNGGPRGGGELCGGDVCLREEEQVKSGTRVEVGCHHAEMNVICNAAANGVPTKGAWLIVNGEPCLMCAKLIHHSGVTRVIVVDGGFAGANGVGYLESHGVIVQREDGPKDPRGNLK